MTGGTLAIEKRSILSHFFTSMWFESLTGFSEESPTQVRNNLAVDGNILKSRVNGRSYIFGELEIPSLAELRERVRSVGLKRGQIVVGELVGDVQSLHAKVSNAGSLFQVASQFNLLEMVSPSVTPERGVAIYENDCTQGPACAIACGAGTIYRNYFAVLKGQIGQSTGHQIDCLKDMGVALGNSEGRLWRMKNGYALASHEGLATISSRLRASSENDIDNLRKLLRIGIQWDTQVTFNDFSHTVSQAYCSAMPVAYTSHPLTLWTDFARLILEASYEATLCASILNSTRLGNNKVFLTLLGGGVFGNDQKWILDSIKRAMNIYKDFDLEVFIVSYGSSRPAIRELVEASKNW